MELCALCGEHHNFIRPCSGVLSAMGIFANDRWLPGKTAPEGADSVVSRTHNYVTGFTDIKVCLVEH